MKTLYLVRHAKSSWKEVELNDEERPLNKRGKHEAPFMGKLLNKMNVKPDLIISSTALRALTTAKIFAEELDYSKSKIISDKSLYLADTKDFFNVLSKVDDTNKSVILFGHNPGMTEFLNTISIEVIDNMPTSCIAGIEFETNSWKEIINKKGKLKIFEYPKKYME